MRSLSLLLVTTLTAGALAAQPPWTQLSLDTCNVGTFHQKNPQADGRGVVIAILDTGVDPGIPGLTKTPDGEVKVIDVQDFSGQGDTDIHTVRRNPETGKLIEYDADGVPIEYTLPDLPEAGEERRFWFGWLSEKKFINSDVPDLNDNGRKDDRFPFMVTALVGDGDDEAVVYVDTNLDRSFADEKPIRNYKVNFDTFTFARTAPEKQIIPLTFALNVNLRQRKVIFHFDDGAHGTHVAGIAAGFEINDQRGFHGVAPGAKVISLKIGHGGIGGPSTTDAKKKALEYAARFARERGVPVVCNLSYGVESTREGSSDIDNFVNEHLQKNPYLVFCTSAGNEGPGLSSVGTPAAARAAISVAALLAVDSARDVMGYHLDKPVVTLFSSRGGELAKPDIATPGWSTSTVPRWVREGDYWSGTSMASPYAAGMCALLLSDALQRQPGAAVRACDIKRALESSAAPVEGFTPLDYGFGIPDMVRARDILQRLIERARNDAVLDYEISTRSPLGPDGRAPSAFWRSTWFPTSDPQVFTIEPIFAPTADAAARTNFTRQFTLRSDAPWCKVSQTSFYLRSEQSARVFVEYDAEALKPPGLYVGVVEALADDAVAFRLVNTVIVPEQVTAAEDYARTFPSQEVKGWQPNRHFFATPPGASAMHVVLRVPEGVESKASMERIFDPFGFQYRDRQRSLDTQGGRRQASAAFAGEEFTPGVWEVVIAADRPDRTWPYELAVRFFGLTAEPAAITECEDAEKPSGDVIITNLFDRPVQATAEARIEGFRATKEETFKGLNDEVTRSFTLGPDYSGVRIKLELSLEAWAEATDIGVLVEDESGKAILKDAFENNTFEAKVNHPKPGSEAKLKLRVVAGFAVSDEERKTKMTSHIDHLLAAPVALKVTREEEQGRFEFVPQAPVKISFAAGSKLPKAPDGTHPVGYLQFAEQASRLAAIRIPIDLHK